MTATEITYSETDTKGRYEARPTGSAEAAELTTSKLSEKLIIVDHTFVPDALRGQGLADILAERVIADARSAGQRIVPLCPFLRAYSEKRRDALSDVIQW